MDDNKKKTYYDLLEDADATKPTYAGTYEQQLDDAYKQIANRKKFSYDIDGDALYKQYKDQYILGGKQAMMDTMGKAAALTGGYGSSYGVTAGNQAYQEYLQKLNDVVPELYGMALDQYNQEGQDLLNQFSMAGSMRDDEYSKFQDDLSNWWQKVDYLTNRADNEYIRQQDSYEKLVSLITTTGYTPSTEELTAAGMSNGEAAAYLNYYKEQKAEAAASTSKSSGSSGRSSSGSSGSNTNTTPTPTPDPEPDPEPEFDIEDELNTLIRNGAAKSEINNYLRQALKSGVITQAQYNSYKNTYAPRGNTY